MKFEKDLDGHMDIRLSSLLVGGGEGMGPLWRKQLMPSMNSGSGCRSGDHHWPQSRVLNPGWKTTNGRVPVSMCMDLFEPCLILCRLPMFLSQKPDREPSVKPAFPVCQSFFYSKVPGQEDGNVDYVVKEGAGVWAPEPEQVVSTLQAWLNAPLNCVGRQPLPAGE